MNLPNRIIYNQDGHIIHETGEGQVYGDVSPRKLITHLDYIEVPFGEIDYNKHKIVAIDVNTKQPITEELMVHKTPEQQRIEELENELLLMADAVEGGIL